MCGNDDSVVFHCIIRLPFSNHEKINMEINSEFITFMLVLNPVLIVLQTFWITFCINQFRNDIRRFRGEIRQFCEEIRQFCGEMGRNGG